MTIDLPKDRFAITDYFRRRIHAQSRLRNSPPIRRVDVKFTFGNEGLVFILFDTRKRAAMDGRWMRQLDNVSATLQLDHWEESFSALDDGQPLEVIRPTGEHWRVATSWDDLTEEAQIELATLIGDMLKTLILSLRQEGAFAPLPLTDDCDFGIEEFDGGEHTYTWTLRADGSTS